MNVILVKKAFELKYNKNSAKFSNTLVQSKKCCTLAVLLARFVGPAT